MMDHQWQELKYFTPAEKWGDAGRMNFNLLMALDRLRKWVRRRIVIHCGYEKRESGWHPTGRAVDCHIVGLHPMEQFIAAARFQDFTGIGVYLWWQNPGLHLDNRPLEFDTPRAIWGSTSAGVYVPMATDFMRQAAALQWPPAKIDARA